MDDEGKVLADSPSAPCKPLSRTDLGMMGVAERHQIAGIVQPTVRSSDQVVDIRRRCGAQRTAGLSREDGGATGTPGAIVATLGSAATARIELGFALTLVLCAATMPEAGLIAGAAAWWREPGHGRISQH